jgi:carotenoid 1,2-hydratase
MNITTELNQELWHELQDPGSYEWWYFDIEDEENGISIVLIWFAGFAFSPYYIQHYEDWKKKSRTDYPDPQEYSGFSFQLYEHGRELVNYIREGRNGLFESSGSNIGVRFENNIFFYDPFRDEYHLKVDFSFPARLKTVVSEFIFKPSHRFSYTKHDGNSAGDRHQWLLSVPKADVTGTVNMGDGHENRRQTFQVRGRGYHDHNLGTMPMHEYISKWYWGRAFSDRFDLVYYVIFFRNNGYSPLAVMMLHDNEDHSQSVMDRVHFQEKKFTRGIFSPLHGRQLSLRQENVGIEIHQKTVLDAGPFYLRFVSELFLHIDGRRISNVRGISEFLNPAPLQSPLMRFFTRSRIWRDGEKSAIYTQYNFFKNHFDWFNRKKF